MEHIKVDSKNPGRRIIRKAAGVLKARGLVVYPTDTAYGLGGNALDAGVIRRVYNVKLRDFSKPTHVVVRDWKMVEELTYTNNFAKVLYNSFLPGPITLILRKRNIVPDILTGGLPTVGIRIPDNSITQLLSKSVNFPYTTPSANKSGGKTPYSVDDVTNQLDIDRIDLILDAGKLPKVLPSTVIDLTTSPPKIIREGPIPKSHLGKALGLAHF